MSRLLVVPAERISGWLTKGEVIDRYYNPGDLFDEVHLLLLNDDAPDPADVQRLVGRAHWQIHNYPAGPRLFVRTLGWRPQLLSPWLSGAVKIAHGVGPDVVRCYSAHLNVAVAREVSAQLGVPYAVSLHINPAVDIRGRTRGWREWLATRAISTVERRGLRDADVVLPVYEPIVPYLESIGVRRFEVAYNMLNGAALAPKADYALRDPVRVVSVGRQFSAKDPSKLMRAVASLPEVELTLVGDGPLHLALKSLAVELGAEDRVHFLPSLRNDEVCRLLTDSDVFAVHTEHWELSKAVLEALLTGLPVVINRRSGPSVPELTDEICRLVDDSVEGYTAALRSLIGDESYRSQLGRSGLAHASLRWSPAATEAVHTSVYRRLLGEVQT